MMREGPTAQFTIFIAGDLAQAKQVCREFCNDISLCVTIEPTSFIYKGGQEEGVRIGLMNYPKYPSSVGGLHQLAHRLADLLRQRLCQCSYSVVGPDKTCWDDTRSVISRE